MSAIQPSPHRLSLDERIALLFPQESLPSTAPSSTPTKRQKKRQRKRDYLKNLDTAHTEAPSSSYVQEAVDKQAFAKVRRTERRTLKAYKISRDSKKTDSDRPLLDKAYDLAKTAHSHLPVSHPLYHSLGSYTSKLLGKSLM